VHIRPVHAHDRDALLALDVRVSDRSIYRRFFTLNRHTADLYVDKLLRPPSTQHQALVASIGDELVGVAGFEQLGPTSAELALLIDDHDQQDGIGTLLIERLAVIARHSGIRQFVADVLTENDAVLRLAHTIGFATTLEADHGVVGMSWDLCS